MKIWKGTWNRNNNTHISLTEALQFFLFFFDEIQAVEFFNCLDMSFILA